MRLAALMILFFGSSGVASAYARRNPTIAAGARIVLFVVIAAVVVHVGLVLRGERELERLVLFEATAVSLCAVLATCLVCGALDEFNVISPPSPWLFWNVGIISWFIARLVLTRLRT